jgi:hypothetical protein
VGVLSTCLLTDVLGEVGSHISSGPPYSTTGGVGNRDQLVVLGVVLVVVPFGAQVCIALLML